MKGARGSENKFQLPSKHKHVNDRNSAWFTPSNYFNRSTKQTTPTKKNEFSLFVSLCTYWVFSLVFRRYKLHDIWC